MHLAKLQKNGTLPIRYKPAIYVDTNFVRHYELAEGLEMCIDEEGNDIDPPWKDDITDAPLRTENEREQILLKLLGGGNNHAREFAQIRHFTCYCLTKACLIMTPISVLELSKLYSEVTHKNRCAETAGAKAIQRMGDKEVGRQLAKLFEKSLTENKDGAHREMVRDCEYVAPYIGGPELDGIVLVPDLHLRLSLEDVRRFLRLLSLLQLEATDVLHVHAAHLLQCEYIASMDQGLHIARDHIRETSGIQILRSPEEVLNVLQANKCEPFDAKFISAGGLGKVKRTKQPL